MATYRIDIPSSSGAVTAATRSSDCVTGIALLTTSDTGSVVSSTALTGNDVIINYNANNTSSTKEASLRLTYGASSGVCTAKNIHLVQSSNTMVTVYVGNHKSNHSTIGVGDVQITTSSGTKTVTFDTTISYNDRKGKNVDFTGYFGTVTQVKVTIGGVLTTISNSCYEPDSGSFWTTNASDCKTLTNGGYLSIVIK